MATKVGIANRALQKLGAGRITDLTQDSVEARAINTAYEPVKLAMLRSHTWSFAIKRASIAADTDPPLFTKSTSFQLPSDFVRLIDPDPEDNFNFLDWQIEGKKVITDQDAPLELRYIYDVEDPNEMDALFREAFAMKLAWELAEQLTQSNSKKKDAKESYEEAISEAKKANAIERISQTPQEDTWVTVRGGRRIVGTGG